MKRIYVNAETLKEAVDYLNDEITFFGFLSNTKAFLKGLLTNPLNTDVNDYLKRHGLNRKDLLNALMTRGIVEKETKIVDVNGSDKFSISYKIPKRNFERKMRRLYSTLFEKNEITESIISEEEGVPMAAMSGGGATGTNNALQDGGNNFNAGGYVNKMGTVRRKIYVTEEQAKILKEMGAGDAGNYQYDVPMKFNGGNDPAYDHKNMMAKSSPKKNKKVKR